jgi:hypothetical protein
LLSSRRRENDPSAKSLTLQQPKLNLGVDKEKLDLPAKGKGTVGRWNRHKSQIDRQTANEEIRTGKHKFAGRMASLIHIFLASQLHAVRLNLKGYLSREIRRGNFALACWGGTFTALFAELQRWPTVSLSD